MKDSTEATVIYDSKYGFTRQYAQWIADALGCSAIARKEVDPRQLLKYKTIVYGGGLYAGCISGLRWFSRQMDALSGRRILLFTCGLSDPSDPENVAHIRSQIGKVLSPRQMEACALFHFRGGIRFPALSLVHRCMLTMMYQIIRKSNPVKKQDQEFLDSYGKEVDYSDRRAIQPLLDVFSQQ